MLRKYQFALVLARALPMFIQQFADPLTKQPRTFGCIACDDAPIHGDAGTGVFRPFTLDRFGFRSGNSGIFPLE